MVVDAYAHVGLPRFLDLADYRALMAENGITRAVLSAFDSSPDLRALHAALCSSPSAFRVLGVPLGDGRAETEAGVRAQLAAGFSGLRLTAEDVRERPWLLDALGRASGVAVVCGPVADPEVAAALLRHLAAYDRCAVVAGHFGTVADPGVLASGPVADLFAHPRFSVVFSRHGGYPAHAVERWAEAVVARTGWRRVLWGSEVPVLFLRDETVAGALSWVDRLGPTERERADFLAGNAERLYFSRPVGDGRGAVPPLELPFEPARRAVDRPSALLPNGLAFDQRLAGRLVRGWLAWGGAARGTPGAYLVEVLDGALPALRGPVDGASR